MLFLKQKQNQNQLLLYKIHGHYSLQADWLGWKRVKSQFCMIVLSAPILFASLILCQAHAHAETTIQIVCISDKD